MNLDSVRDFVTRHPKEIAIGVGGLLVGWFTFGRKSQEESPIDDTPDSEGITPFPVLPYDPSPISPTPTQPTTPTPQPKTPNPGPVPKEIAKLFICPEGFYRVWGRDNNANKVMCRSKQSKQDIPAARRKAKN